MLCSLPVVAQEALVKMSSLPVENMYRIDTDLYRSAQPTENDFEELEQFGINEILNLRNYHIDKINANSKLLLHWVRMNAHSIKDRDVIAALKIIKNRRGAMLIHCHRGSDRTGVICAMYRIVFQNWSKEKAIAELKDERLGHHKIYINIINYIKKVDIDEIKAAIK